MPYSLADAAIARRIWRKLQVIKREEDTISAYSNHSSRAGGTGMGASFTNYQVRSQDVGACIKAVGTVARTSALVSDCVNGWITVYDEQSESQDTSELERIAKQLSAKLATDVFAFLLHDSDVFL